MKGIYKLGLSLLLALGLQTAEAQQLPVFGHYIYNPYLYNPARTGDQGLGSLNLNIKRQWSSLPYAPLTAAFSAEAPIQNRKMGLGGMLYTDQTHIIRKVGGLASYAYHIPFSEDASHGLSAGLSVGLVNQRFDFQSADVENENDPEILGDQAQGTAFDFNMGLNYRWKKLNVGLSMLQGLNNQIRFLDALEKEVRYVNTRHFMASAGYEFALGEEKKFFVRPVVMTRIVPGLPVQLEGNLLFGWKQLLWGGFAYRSSNNETATSAIIATLGVNVQKQMFFAYSFEMGADGNLNNALGNQHEFMLAYRFKERKQKNEKLESEIEKMKSRELDMMERMDQQQKGLDSLRQAQAESEAQQAADKAAMQEQLKQQASLLADQQKVMAKNKKDIEELRQAIKEQPMMYDKVGSIYFKQGQAQLTGEEKAKLEALKQVFVEKPKAMLYLFGNASTDGDPAKNLQLSNERCIVVRKYLIKLGLDPMRIMVLPMGEDNSLEGDEQKINPNDRRVDLILSE
ncbi:PorP/SprF family type IX secretion system membrane protein [Saprospira sp. CCB-QB6]|uniref:PorP/SprF family type IX secretion system membrane protein n=1 Tax=Saprospira sp. CCB-QB6 TaxID=3023936 RepID=UPI00234B304A|nr:PorP/SprF family type IX secretion system membrane protein [Saprospira sp. CCB-QB6]WCL81788.1 PorP/SprF family type IX secretion system membrane protein [Saprospira sp. CCB-QB6]